MCDDYTNEELVLRSRNGDSHALAILVSRFTGKGFARYSAGYLDKEDLEQEGMLGFLSAVSSYRQDGGASFETYARTCIHNRVVSAARRARRSENAVIEPQPQGVSNPLDEVIGGENIRALIGAMDSGLSQTEKESLILYIRGYCVKDISELLGIGEKSAENALQRAKRKLKLFYGGG